MSGIQRINPKGLSESSHYGYAQINAMWQGDRKPASTLIPVPRLAVEGLLFESDAIAAIPNP